MMARARDALSDVLGAVRARLGRALYEPPNFRDTDEQVKLDEFGLGQDDRNYYFPSGWRWLKRVLRKQKIDSSDVFIDFGSGKGRVVYVAAQYPFRKVIGVEISEELNDVARQNIELNRHRLACRNVELVTADAAAYEIPPDMTYAYFYNPFTGDTFRKVIDNIVESIDRNPRNVRVIYPNPQMEEYLLATGRFELVEVVKGGHREGGRGAGRTYVYASRV